MVTMLSRHRRPDPLRTTAHLEFLFNCGVMPYRELAKAGRIVSRAAVAGQLLHRGLVQSIVLFQHCSPSPLRELPDFEAVLPHLHVHRCLVLQP